ncbi:hypothetical protein AAG906_036664 [Vitis piasezkii]
MVMTWLMNSMNEEIGSNYMCYSTAKELWDNVNQMYSDLGNQSQLLWQDLDLFNDYEWKSTDDANHYKQTVEAHGIYKFLVGFNIEFDEVRGGIIGRVPLPKISEVFAKVRREESRRHVMLGKKSNSGIVESSALSVAEGSVNKTASFQRGPGERQWVYPFSKEQMDHLLKLLKSNSPSSIPSVSLAQTGQNSGKKIGSAKLIDGLYYFDGVFSNKRAQGLSSVSSLFVYEQIML